MREIDLTRFSKNHKRCSKIINSDIIYLPSLPDLSGVSRFKQPSLGLTVLVYVLPVSTESLLFFVYV